MTSSVTTVDVAIIGAGFGGLGAAILLARDGRDDVAVFEREDSIGGTWHVNTYPGAQCDIPSALYSFSFAPNRNWSRLYSMQPEIEAYLQDCVDRFGIRDRILTGHEVRDATWDRSCSRWTVTTSRGTWSARILIGAMGPFSAPARPEIDGLDTFEGTVFHSADWNHDHDLTGARVAVVGTGASAVQFVPRIAPLAERLTVFQRTPTWILPHPDRPITGLARRVILRFGAANSMLRTVFGAVQACFVPGLVSHPALLSPAAAIARLHLRRQVADPVLREKLTPRYAFGCKRPTYSNLFYPALCRANVSVETTPVAAVRPRGIETTDGTVHEVDTIVLGTGFAVADHPGFRLIHGSDGRALSEVWANGELSAFNGTTVHGFPNFFVVLGPNSVVYTSQVVTIEAQVAYIVDALRTMDERVLASIDVKASVQNSFAAAVDAALGGSVWNSGGCSSYYLSPSGRNVTFWPGSVGSFERALQRLDPRDYEVVPAPRAVEAPRTPTTKA